MKKIVPILCLALMLAFFFWRESLQRSEPTLSLSTEDKLPSSSPAEQAPAAVKGDRSVSSSPAPHRSSVDTGLLQLTLDHKLDPASLETYAAEHGLAVHKEILGHPKSGQRLVLKINSIPESIAVFDVLREGAYQLSAVRANFPRDADLKELKETLKSQVNRPIDREDDRSLVFKGDEQGLVIWLAQNEDGSTKLAAEYVSHEQE